FQFSQAIQSPESLTQGIKTRALGDECVETIVCTYFQALCRHKNQRSDHFNLGIRFKEAIPFVNQLVTLDGPKPASEKYNIHVRKLFEFGVYCLCRLYSVDHNSDPRPGFQKCDGLSGGPFHEGIGLV